MLILGLLMNTLPYIHPVFEGCELPQNQLIWLLKLARYHLRGDCIPSLIIHVADVHARDTCLCPVGKIRVNWRERREWSWSTRSSSSLVLTNSLVTTTSPYIFSSSHWWEVPCSHVSEIFVGRMENMYRKRLVTRRRKLIGNDDELLLIIPGRYFLMNPSDLWQRFGFKLEEGTVHCLTPLSFLCRKGRNFLQFEGGEGE